MDDLQTRFARAVAQHLLDKHGAERAIEIMRQAIEELDEGERSLNQDISDALHRLVGTAQCLVH